MANAIVEQKIIDGNKRALVKYVATVDSAAANVIVLDASSLAYSLNANGMIMSSNTHIKSQYRVSVKRIFGQGQFKSKGFVSLRWGGANTELVTFGDGQFDYHFDREGLAASIPFADSANCTGDIVYSTTGVAAGDAFTLFIDLKKDNRDFDSGKTADPSAFNKYGIP